VTRRYVAKKNQFLFVTCLVIHFAVYRATSPALFSARLPAASPTLARGAPRPRHTPHCRWRCTCRQRRRRVCVTPSSDATPAAAVAAAAAGVIAAHKARRRVTTTHEALLVLLQLPVPSPP